MMAQPFLQFGTVALDPVLNCRVVHFQAALAEQFFDIAERERVPKVPAHGAQNQGVGALIQRGGRAVAGMLAIATAGGS